ncbi:MAG: NADH-quinone oxidoreductase subunit NuoN [Magnetococcus sp. WYHC-3]
MAVPIPDINLIPVLPEILVSVMAMAILLGGSAREQERSPVAWLVAIVAIVVAAIIAQLVASPGRVDAFGGMFVSDPFALYAKLLLFLATAIPLTMSCEYLREQRLDQAEYFVLTLFALVGGMIMVSAGDFLVLYLGLELMSLSIYVLAAFRRDAVRSNEAGLKYFILGSMASGLLLYGISLIYGLSGTTMFHSIAAQLASGALPMGIAFHMGVVLIISGLAFKVAAAPFHMWAPDVYEGAPTSVTAFMAAMPKIAGFAALYRVLLDAFSAAQDFWGPVLVLLAVISMAVGALAAIAQTNLKRMLAYSSIGHVGYALLGFATGSPAGAQAVLVYLTIYIIMNLGAFTVMMVLEGQGKGEEIDDYKGLAARRPLLAAAMALFMFSMAGIPPLAGFMGKFYVFMAVVEAHMYVAAVLGVLFSAVGAFYYLRIIKLMYFDEAQQDFAMVVTPVHVALLSVGSVTLLYLGVLPGGLVQAALDVVKLFP